MKFLSKRIIILLIAAIWLLSACRTPQEATPTLPAPTQPEATDTLRPSVTAAATESPTPAETAILQAALSSPTASPTPQDTSRPTSTLPSLEFSLPSPTVTTTSEAAFRPPAYPVPWALSPHDHFYFSRPIAADNADLSRVNYRYGDVLFGDHVHTGIDIPTEMRVPILAAGDGKVIWAGYGLYLGGFREDDPYGISVVIKHSFGYQGQALFTIYAHLDEHIVHAGDVVSNGDVVGLTGDTGHTTGPHLHFEVRVGKNDFFSTRNPSLWLAPPQGWGVLAGRIESGYGRLLEKQSIYIHSRVDSENEEIEDQVQIAESYTRNGINPDAYYQENFVLGDLPAGYYRVNIPYFGIVHTKIIEIRPGEVTYITFQGWRGISVTEPPDEVLFTPAP